MTALPDLATGQSWCCAKGCGPCGTKESAFEYSREEFPNGDVISKTQRIFVSTCCSADLMLWDDGKQDFLNDWEYTGPPAANGPAYRPGEVLTTMLWLYRRLPRVYGRQPEVEQTITALARQAGTEVGEFLEERGAVRPGERCTCPSGDGSLRWPCPVHPPVVSGGLTMLGNLATTDQGGHNDVLEQAAKVCDAAVPKYERFDDQRAAGNTAKKCAAEIRSLKSSGTPATGAGDQGAGDL